MSTLILSLLLLVLIAIGLVMGKQLEGFASGSGADVVAVSPTVASLIATPSLKPVPQVDTLAREQEAVAAREAGYKKAEEDERKKPCPKCKACPDMSQYIKRDEVPCWNCTL